LSDVKFAKPEGSVRAVREQGLSIIDQTFFTTMSSLDIQTTNANDLIRQGATLKVCDLSFYKGLFLDV